MGYAIAWLAVETEDPSALFQEARIEPSAEPDPYFEASISGCALEGGWFVLVGQRCDHRLVDPEFLRSLSQRYSCVACAVEEHVMYSSAAYWKGGSEVWRLAHDAQKGKYELELRGELPEGFDELRQGIFEEQKKEDAGRAEVDFVFDLPLLAAKEITGFKHDEDPVGPLKAAPRVFADLAPRRSRPWWKVW